jgi:cell division protein FtsZ
MTINLNIPDIRELRPRLTVFGVGGAGGNAVNNMISAGLQGVEFVVANTDAQALTTSKAERVIQMGVQVTGGLGAGSQPEVGRAAAEEAIDEIRDHLNGAHMVFVTAGMGGGTGTGAAPVVARVAKELGILTVGVVTKPFHFEGHRRMRYAEAGIVELQKCVDTLIIIPNQNLFRVANEKTTFADAFAMADQVLYSGVACITDLMVKEGLINLDFADVRAVMREMGKAMMGTGEASGEKRALRAAEAAIANPLIDDVSMKGARGLLISITGGRDLTLYEVDEAATRIREEVDEEANIIVGATFEENLEGIIRVSVVATGIDSVAQTQRSPNEARLAAIAQKAKAETPVPPQPQGRSVPAVAATATSAVPATGVPTARPTIEQVATAAVAAAVLSPGSQADVTVRPIAPKPSLFVEPAGAEPTAAVSETEVPKAFIPPAPDRVRMPRMPRIEDLPLPGQNQLRARDSENSESGPDKQRLSLLQRLAQVGLGRRDDTEIHKPQAHGEPPSLRESVTLPPLPPRQPPRGPDIASEYARKSHSASPQGLDVHGRPASAPQKPVDDEHLEIPAFLRRQAN